MSLQTTKRLITDRQETEYANVLTAATNLPIGDECNVIGTLTE